MSQPVYHFSAMKMQSLFGCTFPEFAKQRQAGKPPGHVIDESFFKPAQYAIETPETGAVLNASLNPVSPCHVLSFPTPEILGAQKENGTWANMPDDGDFLSVSKSAVTAAVNSLYNWTTSGYKNAPELQTIDSLKQSFWTANLGRAAYLSVPLLHVHHLMAFDENSYENFKEYDPDTDRFIRPLNTSPELLLRRAFEDKHSAGAVLKMEKETEFIPLSAASDSAPTLSINRPGSVKINDFSVEFSVPIGGVTVQDVQAMTETAYDIQKYLHQYGAAGYTMVMDSTALQYPDKHVGDTLRMYFVTHMPGDLEWLRGGFVYTAQKYTAPSMQDLAL